MMKNTRFETPVAVVVGLGLRYEIGSLDEIHRFLTEWTTSRRGALHAVALETCEAVRMGELSVDHARKAFIDFAKASHILCLELDEPTIAIDTDQNLVNRSVSIPHPVRNLAFQTLPHAPAGSHRGRASNM